MRMYMLIVVCSTAHCLTESLVAGLVDVLMQKDIDLTLEGVVLPAITRAMFLGSSMFPGSSVFPGSRFIQVYTYSSSATVLLDMGTELKPHICGHSKCFHTLLD